MNTRFFRIAASSAAILLLVGISVFLVYNTNAPVQEVRVYEMPNAIAPSVETGLATTGTTVSIATGKQTGLDDNDSSAQYSTEYDQRDEDTATMGESTIEPCCPDEANQSLVGDIDFGQGVNLDHNPTSPEMIADSKRDAEWFVAIKAYDQKFDELHAERLELEAEFEVLIPEDPAEIVRAMRDPDIQAKLRAWQKKKEDLKRRSELLKQERPVRPTPTHTH